MNPQIINSTNSVTTSTKRKREAERSMNWTVEETQVLLCAWSDERVQKSLAENLRNRHVFKHLSARMSDMGFSRSPHQCRLRVKTLKANYVRARVLKSVDGAQPCSFRYYAEMDAVLGRKAAEGMGGGGGGGGGHLDSMMESGGRHLGFFERPEGGLFDDSVDETVRGHAVVGVGGRLLGHLGAEIKMEEDRDASTDEFEFSTAGFTQTLGPRRQRIILRDSLIPPRPIGISAPVEDELSSEAPSPFPPPQPASPLPPSPPPEPDPSAGAAPPSHHHHNNNNGGASPPQPQPRSLEPALKHLADCFQSLVSESRRLLVQLEGQRQEQGRWHRELLAQWLERDERRQSEAADREERRERARMEHEIRVLRLLTGLSQRTAAPPTPRPGCCCGGAEPTGEASADQGRKTEEEEEEEEDGAKSGAL